MALYFWNLESGRVSRRFALRESDRTNILIGPVWYGSGPDWSDFPVERWLFRPRWAAFSPDGRYVLATERDGRLRLWDLYPSPWPFIAAITAAAAFAAFLIAMRIRARRRARASMRP